MQQADVRSLWELTIRSGLSPRRFISDGAGSIAVAEVAAKTSVRTELNRITGRSILISCERQLPAVLAMLELDGIAGRLMLCPPDVSTLHLPELVARAEIDAIITDGAGPAPRSVGGAEVIGLTNEPAAAPYFPGDRPKGSMATEWLLLTSGTMGLPKIVVHTLNSLTGPLEDGLVASDAVWATFYDVRRYGGLQILLRSLLGGGSMVLSRAGEDVADFLTRAGQRGITHISGTPSHWRRALMSPAVTEIAPNYVRLSGEIADQAILDNLATAFPQTEIAHAFASTEAGVAFDVRDGCAGFPSALIGQTGGRAELKIRDGSLCIRSNRVASRYFGSSEPLTDTQGFVDTGDIVELRGDRYYFMGRREGVINVGGMKVHPEEVEAIINRHPSIQMSRVRGRRSPITGALVAADVVVRPSVGQDKLRGMVGEILDACRQVLPAYKVPVTLRQVSSLEVGGSGKLLRADS